MASKRRRTGPHEGQTETLPTICMMGATGVGKGSTLNSCFQTDKYSVSHMIESDTVKPVSFVLPWRGTGSPMRGVDLCGFSDSEGRDTGFIDSMVAYLREEVRYVHCFLLLFNSQEARIGIHLKDMLVALKNVFGLPFMKNVMIGFTRWEYTRRAAILRRGVTKERLAASVNALLRNILGHDHDSKCIFLDNAVTMCTDEELQELYGDELPAISGAFDEALEGIRHFALGNAPFHCTGIEGTLAERDVGRDMAEREAAAHAEGRDAFESLSTAWDALDIQEPEGLEGRLQAAASEKRDVLNQYLAVKTKPDLEHVKAAVLESFDGKVPAKIDAVCLKNRGAAYSFNRGLRAQLADDYRAFIMQKLQGSSCQQCEQFREVCEQECKVIADFVGKSKGGSLAWGSFAILQEQLRWEQLEARDRIFGEDLAGDKLPGIRAVLNSAKDLIVFLGAHFKPEWLLKLAS